MIIFFPFLYINQNQHIVFVVTEGDSWLLYSGWTIYRFTKKWKWEIRKFGYCILDVSIDVYPLVN